MRNGLLFGITLWALLACGEGGNQLNPNTEEPVVGNKDDVTFAGALSVDEKRIAARVDGADLLVDIPMVREAGSTVTGKVTATLVSLDGLTTLTSGTGEFTLDAEEGQGTVKLDAARLPAAGEAEVLYLLRYGVKWEGHQLSGQRSLFFTLPKFDIQARFPSALYADGKAKVRVFAIDPTRNAPLADVPVTLTLKPKAIGEEPTTAVATQQGTTDADGTAVFELPGQDAGDYVLTASSTQSGYLMGAVEDDVSVVREARVLLTTDKPMYQPGQMMEVRALILKKPALNADGGREVTFEVADGKGNMIFRKYATTNDFGIASTRLKIASQVNMGDWEVRAILGDTKTIKTVPVKYYALPKFKVSATLDKGFYLAGDVLHGVLNVRYFFGKPVAGGAVQVVASAYDIGFTAFQTVNGVTNGEGVFDFDLTLPDYLVGQDLESGNALVTLEVTVIDTAEHAEKAYIPLVVAKAPINLVAIPESGELVPGLENTLYLFATDPLGAPVDATFQVELGGAQAAVGSLGLGIASFTVKPEGPVSFTVSASDAQGAQASQAFSFDPGKSSGGLIVRSDRNLYRVGETAKVRVFATDAQGRLFLDLIKDGQTAGTYAVDVKDGVAGLDLDLDGSLVGDLVVEAYMITTKAEIVRDKKLIFVKDADGLAITITPDKGSDPYGPGQDAAIDFEVKDASGQPRAAALGVQIVDEAVYALTEMKPGLLETYFLIEDELQQPRYEIHGAEFNFNQIVTSDPDDEHSQTVAGAAFAALDQAGMGGTEKSSWAGALAKLPASLQPYYTAHMNQVSEAVQSLIDNGSITWDGTVGFLNTQKMFYDYWGNLYSFTGSDYWNMTVKSLGPDELEGTADDYSAQFSVYSHGDDWGWAEEGDFNGGPGKGGGDPQAGAADASMGVDTGTQEPPSDPNSTDKPKIRSYFPETLYFNPALITDESGKARVSLTMADSITEWRITTVGNTKDGVLGSKDQGITVFQDFFVDIDFPATLTRNDEVTFPVAIYNYLPITQTVHLELEPGDWYQLVGDGQADVEVNPGEVTVKSFPVKVLNVGWHALTVTGIGTTMSDAVQRMVLVKPDGKEFRESKSGMLKGESSVAVSYPTGLIPGSQELLVKVYPGILAQAVEGLDSLLQMPSGCFEQTTSTNWPNTLVMDYLKASGQINPAIELKASDYLQQGYQRLLTYECTQSGGGFTWFGDPSPGNIILSAMGVMEFSDMAKVMEVDQAVIQRTAAWLAGKQQGDGHWVFDQGSEFATVSYDDVKTTAWVSWCLGISPYEHEAAAKGLAWLAPQVEGLDLYALALAANAYANVQPEAGVTATVLDKLADAAVEDGDKVYWKFDGQSQYGWGGDDGGGSGVSGTSIEITALAVQAFIKAGAHLDLAGKALAFLAANKDSFGNWGSTHATILSLRAMIMSLQNKTEQGEGNLEVYLNGELAGTLAITAENRNVFHQFELGNLVNVAAANDLTVQYEGTGNLMYQAVWAYYLPYGGDVVSDSDVLSIEVQYDKTHLAVDDVVNATATVTNLTEANLNMVMVDLGVPPGFTVLTDSLASMVEQQQIMKYELPGQQITIYLEKLDPHASLVLPYGLQAKYPVKAASGDSSAYLYYDSATKDEAAPTAFEVQ
jgi:hypothetical protein